MIAKIAGNFGNLGSFSSHSDPASARDFRKKEWLSILKKER
jgi:hypothetical protein